MTTHRWYARPVFFVTDIERAIRFYVDMLGHLRVAPSHAIMRAPSHSPAFRK